MRILVCALRGRGGVSGAKDSWHLKLEIGGGQFTNTVTSVQKDNLIVEEDEQEKDRSAS